MHQEIPVMGIHRHTKKVREPEWNVHKVLFTYNKRNAMVSGERKDY